MDSQDREKFNKALSLCIAATGKKPPEEIHAAFWVLLNPYPLVDVVKALKMRMSDPNAGRFIPSAAEIMDLVLKNNPDLREKQEYTDLCTKSDIGLGKKPTDKLVDSYTNELLSMSPEERRKAINLWRHKLNGNRVSDGFRREEHDKLLESRKPKGDPHAK